MTQRKWEAEYQDDLAVFYAEPGVVTEQQRLDAAWNLAADVEPLLQQIAVLRWRLEAHP